MSEVSREEIEEALKIVTPYLSADAKQNAEWAIGYTFKKLEKEKELYREVAKQMVVDRGQLFSDLSTTQVDSYLGLAKSAVTALRNEGWEESEYAD